VLLAHALLLLPLGQKHALPLDGSAPLLLAVLQDCKAVRILILAQRTLDQLAVRCDKLFRLLNAWQ
jgi:hypothetical protein